MIEWGCMMVREAVRAERSGRLWRGVTVARGSSRVFEIRLYDEVLATFEVRSNAVGVRSYHLDASSVSRPEALPLELVAELTDGALVAWLRTRTVPKHQEFAQAILSAANVDPHDMLAQVGVSLGLSVSDALWVAPSGLDLTWGDVNLYDNDDDDVLSLVAYSGELVDTQGNSLLSTSWATGGQFAKAWRRMADGRLTLYKAGSEREAADLGQEPWSEFVASQVAAMMGIAHVSYGLEVWKNKLASTCALLNDARTGLAPSYLCVGTGGFQRALAAYAQIGPQALEAFRDMATFDALIANTDRHAGNYAFLRDNESGALTGIAPLYDHNLSLFARDMPSDYPAWRDASRLSGWGVSPAGADMSFDQQAELCMGPRQRQMLERVSDMELTNVVGAAAVPSERLDSWQEYLRVRARRLLEIPQLPEDDLWEVIASQDMSRGDLPLARSRVLTGDLRRFWPKGMAAVRNRSCVAGNSEERAMQAKTSKP